MRRDTLIDFFDDLAALDGPFVVHDDSFRTRTFSYTDITRASRAFGARLAAAGIHKGTKVVLFSENRPEWLVAFWGCLLIGAVVVPIDYRSSPDFLVRVARIVDAAVVLVGQDVPTIRELDGSIPIWPLLDLDWSATATPPPTALTRDDVAEIIFTSGATAEPKGVVITHRNVLANIVPVENEVATYAKYARPFAPLRFLNLLPLSHMFGQAMATFIPPMLAGVVVFMRGYNPGDIVDQIRTRRISVLVSVPKILDVLKEHLLRAAVSAKDAGVVRTPGIEGPGPWRAVSRIAGRWWHHRDVHRMFGAKFWAAIVGAAPLDGALEKWWGDLGFAVIQGYGLTETAPIVTLNHPFGTKRGSVGKAIAGVEMKVADDGEILVRGENVTQGYFNAADETSRAFEDGWFHTGDIGEITADGQVFIRGRKKEMIVTSEGLNVFPEDVERVLNQLPGVRESAVVGIGAGGSGERVHAVLVVDPGIDPDAVARQANAQLADHQKVRRAVVWPEPELPRTEGTRKLKRAAIREWAKGDGTPQAVKAGTDALAALVARYAGRDQVSSSATLEELGLSSLERVELMVALEDTFGSRIDEGRFAEARSVADLKALVERGAEAGTAAPTEPVEFPSWNRSRLAWFIRRISLPTWILPAGRLFVTLKVDGLHHLDAITSPVMFAVNHQSHFDVPTVLMALPPRLRYRIAPAMAKEFFKAHFFPKDHGRRAWLTNSLNYYLAALFFNAFPLPQREAGTRQTLRYIGEVLAGGYSVLIFPEGKRTDDGQINSFRPGIGMIGSKLDVPVVPVRIEGLDRILHHTARWPKPGQARVTFGAPMRLHGEDYDALARQVEEAVRAL